MKNSKNTLFLMGLMVSLAPFAAQATNDPFVKYISANHRTDACIAICGIIAAIDPKNPNVIAFERAFSINKDRLTDYDKEYIGSVMALKVNEIKAERIKHQRDLNNQYNQAETLYKAELARFEAEQRNDKARHQEEQSNKIARAKSERSNEQVRISEEKINEEKQLKQTEQNYDQLIAMVKHNREQSLATNKIAKNWFSNLIYNKATYATAALGLTAGAMEAGLIDSDVVYDTVLPVLWTATGLTAVTSLVNSVKNTYNWYTHRQKGFENSLSTLHAKMTKHHDEFQKRMHNYDGQIKELNKPCALQQQPYMPKTYVQKPSYVRPNLQIELAKYDTAVKRMNDAFAKIK